MIKFVEFEGDFHFFSFKPEVSFFDKIGPKIILLG